MMDLVQGASIQGVVGLGEKWKRVPVVGRVKGMAWLPPEEKRDTAAEEGYSIHAGVELDGRDREAEVRLPEGALGRGAGDRA